MPNTFAGSHRIKNVFAGGHKISKIYAGGNPPKLVFSSDISLWGSGSSDVGLVAPTTQFAQNGTPMTIAPSGNLIHISTPQDGNAIKRSVYYSRTKVDLSGYSKISLTTIGDPFYFESANADFPATVDFGIALYSSVPVINQIIYPPDQSFTTSVIPYSKIERRQGYEITIPSKTIELTTFAKKQYYVAIYIYTYGAYRKTGSKTAIQISNFTVT